MANFTKFFDGMERMHEATDPNSDAPEAIPADDREREFSSEDDRPPFTVKLKDPMPIPNGVQRIVDAFQSEALSDIEVELHKEKPNPELYHLGEVFGKKLLTMPKEQRKKIKITKMGCFVGGGAVRDFLMTLYHPEMLHKSPKDWNLVTEARPMATRLILMNAEPPIPCDRTSSAKVTADLDGKTYEIETFHETPEGEGDRHDFTVFTTAARDAKRRDFRVNAMLYDPIKQVIIDHVGGFGDLAGGKVVLQPVGSSEKLFGKDPIAALRGIRLHGKLVGGGTDNMHKDLLHGLKNVEFTGDTDRRKVHDEFIHALKSADDQNHLVANLAKVGKGKSLLHQIFPGLEVDNDVNLVRNTLPAVAIAMILRYNPPDRLHQVKQVLHKGKFDTNEIADVLFLLSLPRFNRPEQAREFDKAFSATNHLVPMQVNEYAKMARLPNSNLVAKFLKHRANGYSPAAHADSFASPEKMTAAKMERRIEDFSRRHGIFEAGRDESVHVVAESAAAKIERLMGSSRP